MTILDRIVRQKERQLWIRKKKFPLEELKKKLVRAHVPSAQSLFPKNSTCIIGEVKRKSPREGALLRGDILKQAYLYEKYCAAISVVTEEIFFGGSIEDFAKARKHVALPLLRKDFVIDEYQIYESRYCGADRILFIAALLSEKKLKRYVSCARRLGMRSLVEAHTLAEAKRALRAGSDIVGINQRDLKTFRVDRGRVTRIASRLPRGMIVIAESGIESKKDIERMQSHVHGVLIGTSLLRAKKPEMLLREFLS